MLKVNSVIHENPIGNPDEFPVEARIDRVTLIPVTERLYTNTVCCLTMKGVLVLEHPRLALFIHFKQTIYAICISHHLAYIIMALHTVHDFREL